MQTRMLELFDEFQTRCNADGRKHRLRVRSLYRMFHLSRCRVIGLDAFYPTLYELLNRFAIRARRVDFPLIAARLEINSIERFSIVTVIR